MIRCEMLFHGRVQGVGFRCTARSLARELNVTGWVRNLPDGSVQLLAEGDSGDVGALEHRLKGLFVVHDVKATTLPPTGQYVDFVVIA